MEFFNLFNPMLWIVSAGVLVLIIFIMVLLKLFNDNKKY